MIAFGVTLAQKSEIEVALVMPHYGERENFVSRRLKRTGSRAQQSAMAAPGLRAVSGFDASCQPLLVREYRLFVLEVVQ